VPRRRSFHLLTNSSIRLYNKAGLSIKEAPAPWTLVLKGIAIAGVLLTLLVIGAALFWSLVDLRSNKRLAEEGWVKRRSGSWLTCEAAGVGAQDFSLALISTIERRASSRWKPATSSVSTVYISVFEFLSLFLYSPRSTACSFLKIA
jgi:hypothetical protein